MSEVVERPAREKRHWAIPVLSVVTAGWLGLHALIGVTGAEAIATWPITSYKMFSGTTGEMYTYSVQGTAEDGATVVLDHDDLGLTELQLSGYLRRRIAERDGTLRPGAQRHLTGMAELWSDAIRSEVQTVSVLVEVRQPREAGAPEVREVARWERS